MSINDLNVQRSNSQRKIIMRDSIGQVWYEDDFDDICDEADYCETMRELQKFADELWDSLIN